VNADVLAHARPGAERFDSSKLTLEDLFAIYERALRRRLVVARVHSGDPSLYGAIHEQIAFCEEHGLPFEVVPGVSSLGAAAAVLGCELTVPRISQSLVITRLGNRTPMPAGEEVRAFAAHGTTMALFLSAARPGELQRELVAGGYAPATPCAVVVRATWPDEQVLTCRLDALGRTIRSAGVHKTALVLVGPAVAALEARERTRSRLYDPAFGHEFRRPAAWQEEHPAHAEP
jgi:precorrin-4 C11-methyltransferase